jgi:hypothetical protein
MNTNSRITTKNKKQAGNEFIGKLVLIKGVDSGLCLKGSNEREILQQVQCNIADKSQQFTIEKAGQWFRIKNSNGFYIDVQNGSTTGGNEFWIYQGNGTAAQNYSIEKASDGFTLKAQISNKCLDVKNWSKNVGEHIIQWDCFGAKNQQWVFTEVNSVADSLVGKLVLMKGVDSGLCVKGSNEREILQQVQCNGADKSQQFTIEKAGEWIRIKNSNGFYIDVQNGSTTGGNEFWIFQGNGTAAQNYRMEKASDGFTLKAQISNKCVDVKNWSKNAGEHIIQWDCHGGKNQQWVFPLAQSVVVTPPAPNGNNNGNTNANTDANGNGPRKNCKLKGIKAIFDANKSKRR